MGARPQFEERSAADSDRVLGTVPNRAPGARDRGPPDRGGSRSPPTRHVSTGIVALLVGAALAGLRPGRPPRGGTFGPPVWWVADRGGAALFGLDAELFVTDCIRWSTPVRLVAPVRSGSPVRRPASGDSPEVGALWVAAALAGHPDGLHRLSLLRPEGRGRSTELVAFELEPPLDLVGLPGGGLAWLEGTGRGGGPRLVRLEGPADRPRRLAIPAPPGSVELAASPHGLAVGTVDGRVFGLRGRWRSGPRVGERVLDLAGTQAGPWVLARAGGGLAVVRLGAGLRPQARATLPGRDGRLAPVGVGAVLVVTDGSDPRCFRVGPAGRVRDLGRLGLRGVSAVLPAGNGWIATAPGAVLRGGAPDPSGWRAARPLPGQGGFDYLVDLVALRP